MEPYDHDAQRLIQTYLEKLHFHLRIAPGMERWVKREMYLSNLKPMEPITIDPIVLEFIQSLRAKNIPRLTNLLDRQAQFEFPYTPAGLPPKIKGRHRIVEYVKELPYAMSEVTSQEMTIIPSIDPFVWVLEFKGAETMERSGKTHPQSYLSLIKTREEKILHYKEYFNPINRLEALLNLDPDPVISRW